MHKIDEADRALLADEVIPVPPRLMANVMAEVRAISAPAPTTFPWDELSTRLALYGGLVSAAAVLYACFDPTVFVPVARELVAAGAAVCSGVATVHLGRHFV